MRPSTTTLSGRGGSRPEPRFAVKFTNGPGIRQWMISLPNDAGSILRVQLNRPTKRNAMTSAMYVALASIFNEAAKDENTRVVLWHGAGDSFCAGNDIEDFLKYPPGPGESPQARLMSALRQPRQAARRRGPWRRDRRRHHHADALRLHLRGREHEIPDALHQSCCRTGIRIELLGAGADRSPPCGGAAFVGSPIRCQARRGVGSGDPRSYPTRTCWRGRPKRPGNWQRSRLQRYKPARGS